MSTKIELSESLQKTISLEQRALADGGTLINRNHTVSSIPYLLLRQNPSLVLTPSAIKAGKIYDIIPNNSFGDFSYTQNTANGTIINEQGNIETVPANTPRITWENGEPEILVEESRTNQNPNSLDFEWDASRIVAQQSFPNGGYGDLPYQSLERIDSGAVFIDIDPVSTEQTAVRFYIRNISSTYRLWFRNVGVSSEIDINIDSNFNVTENTVINGTYNVTDTGDNGWHEVIAKINSNIGDRSIVYQEFDSIIGRTFELCQLDFFESHNIGSRIITNGAIATRNDDTIAKSGLASVIGQTEGAIFMDCELSNLIQSDIGFIFDVFEDPTADRISAWQNAGSSSIRVLCEENNSTISINDINITDTTLKIFVVYTATSFKVFINGSQVVNDAVTFGGYANCNEVVIGKRGGGTLINEGIYIKSFNLFKTPVTDTQAINLTTL